MEPRHLLETNICIYIRQNRPERVLHRFRKLRIGEVVLSVITYGELFCVWRDEKRATHSCAGTAA